MMLGYVHIIIIFRLSLDPLALLTDAATYLAITWKMTINKRLYGHWVFRREAGTAVIRTFTHKELGPAGGKAVP